MSPASICSRRSFWLAFAVAGCLQAEGSAQSSDPEVLEMGKPLERRLSGGQSREYRLPLQAGQYARVGVYQKTIGLRILATSPEGKTLYELARGLAGNDMLVPIVADRSGDYRVEVTGAPAAPAGDYAISVMEVATANEVHRHLAEAARLYGKAASLWARGGRESILGAIAAFEESLPHWRASGDLMNEAFMLYSIGTAYAEIGDREKALQYATKSLPVARACGKPGAEAWALQTIGSIHNGFGDRRKAVEYFEQALPLLRSSGNGSAELTVLNDLGIAYRGMGERRKALEYFHKALALIEPLQDRRRMASIHGNIGVTSGDLGDYQESLANYQRALALHREAGNRQGEAISLNNLGTAYSNLADYQKALDAYRTAVEIHRSLGMDWNIAISLHNVAWAHAALGDRQRSRSLYQEALDILRKVNDQAGLSNTLNNLGETESALGNHDKALEYLGEVLALRRAIGDRDGEAGAIAVTARVLGKRGEAAKAREQFEAALAIMRPLGNRRRLAGVLLNYGALLRTERDHAASLPRLEESLAIDREIRDRRGEADALAELARLERDRGDVERAHERANEALALLESLRLTVASPTLRAQFFTAAQDIQEMNIALLMRLHVEHPGKGFSAAAFAESERSRARSLLESLGESRTEIGRDVDPALTVREQELEQLIYAKAERQTRLLNGKPAAAETAAAARELNALTAELESVQSRIRQASPQYASLTQSPLDLKQIQDQVLDRDTVLLEFSLGTEKSFLWAVTQSGLEAFELPRREIIETEVRRVYELLTARNRRVANEAPTARAVRVAEADSSYFAAAATLSQMLLGKAAPLIRGKRLLIVGDGALQQLPFASLPEPVGDRFGGRPAPMLVGHEILAAPSASVMAMIRKESTGRKAPAKTLAVLADPVFSANDSRVLPALAQSVPPRRTVGSRASSGTRSGDGSGEFLRLRFSRMEADAITRLTPPDSTFKAVDFDANRDAVLGANLGDYRIVHLATHAVLNNEHPELSGVVLSQVDRAGRPRNGFLRLYDIYNLRLASDLVVLSACETALGGEIRGEGLIGLTRGFLYAGAPRVVATLWKIDDRTTAELMKHFYESMFTRGERPAAALRSAQTAMWKTKGWDNPYYWAAFTLHGEWR